ncbi:MAG: NPCBM/NEW2 domain-containing protein [Thermoguttaceae bacterium]
MKREAIYLFSALVVLCLTAVLAQSQELTVYFDELDPISISQSFGTPQHCQNVMGGELSVAGKVFDQGIGVHANSKIVYQLEGEYLRFEAFVGVDDAMKDHKQSSIVFQVFVDGEKKFDSGIVKINENAMPVNVSLENADVLELIVTDAGDGIDCDHGDWGDAKLITIPSLLKNKSNIIESEEKAYTVKSPVLSLDLSETGKIVGMQAGKVSRPICGKSDLKGCQTEGDVTSKSIAESGMEFTRTVKNVDGNGATVTERFVPTPLGIRWEMEIVGLGDPWTTSINRIFDYNAPEKNDVLFWTAWSDPRCGRPSAYKKEDIVNRDPATILYPIGTEHNWVDPLLPQPLVRAKLYYGLTPYSYSNPGDSCPFAGNLFSIPMLTLMEPKEDFGITLGQDPSDKLLDITLDITKTGRTNWSYLRFRISKDSPVKLRADLIPHEADWRGGMRWMRKAHPEYMEPVNPLAHEISGTAAYDRSPGISKVCENAERFHKMGFKVNWQASWDFPFFGMYIPPTKDDNEKWKAFGGWEYSVAQYGIDAKRMREAGFFTLNYFNVFEIGTYTKWPETKRTIDNDADLWKNNDDFIYAKLKDGIVTMPKDIEGTKGKRGAFEENPIGSWEGSLVFDCAVPSVREFLLNQTKLHLEKVPDASGICIDRLDWIRWYNLKADDGYSWFHDRPARCLLASWNDIMEDLGPLMHNEGKVIYANNHDKRIDALKHIDGIYDEFGQAGAPLNLTALQCVAKPALVWTSGPHDLQPNPDAFFQKNLFLGTFPTAPLPDNCHCINPDPVADQFYLDYGKMMTLMRGRKWVLQPHCIEVKNGAAKVNMFEIPEGFVIPVCFAGDATEVEVVIQNVKGLKQVNAEAFHPASETSVPVLSRYENGTLTLNVPVKRGCAMVKLTPQ